MKNDDIPDLPGWMLILLILIIVPSGLLALFGLVSYVVGDGSIFLPLFGGIIILVVIGSVLRHQRAQNISALEAKKAKERGVLDDRKKIGAMQETLDEMRGVMASL